MSLQQAIGLAVCLMGYVCIWSSAAVKIEFEGPSFWPCAVVLSPMALAVPAALGVFG